MEPRACQVKAQLRPLGRPVISTLSNYALRYTRRASKLSYKYTARGCIFTLFVVNVLLYAVTVISTEILVITFYLGYHLCQRVEHSTDAERKQLKILKSEETSLLKQVIRVMGIDFAPAATPLTRRLQTLAAALCSFSFLFAGIFFTVLAIILSFSNLYWIVILYTGWYVYDFRTHEKGGHRVHWYRRWKLWTKMAEYFPICLIKTAGLPADRNYIMGYHPHGIMAAGSFINFGTEGTGFAKLFPGIAPHLMTLTLNFMFPFYRDLLLGLGIVSVCRDSLDWILKNKGVGNAAIIVVGGAQEALDAHRNADIALTLTSRKGFIKIALQNGADLVPVFSFGENNVYAQAANPPGSKLRDIQPPCVPWPRASTIQLRIRPISNANHHSGWCPNSCYSSVETDPATD
ncbi:2-acylglycerol O-acyltransferase 2-A-like isoform X2 [Varroa jacobsoni]|uniref:Acyltransferase n=1 Tax=Varroa destructor TaxID=109461 RepID=A0A7M7KTK9_VARDE|nr:2-acylglycerol O-acyltransferase 2-A-like isoform X2 [Varroa destructor]XP_022691172.1 2-acylglycerol O-acyltransferase 2-A-like isoform X2 [Varroa jacobsoni]